MVDLEFRQELPEGAIVFDNPSFDNSIIGVSTENRVVYDYEKMVEELLSEETEIDEEQARDWIEYDTIRSVSYLNEEQAPIIIYSMSREEK